jgi:hypothetical protein
LYEQATVFVSHPSSLCFNWGSAKRARPCFAQIFPKKIQELHNARRTTTANDGAVANGKKKEEDASELATTPSF